MERNGERLQFNCVKEREFTIILSAVDKVYKKKSLAAEYERQVLSLAEVKQ